MFPKPAPVLSHITHSPGSDSSHKPTVSDLSLPQLGSAIETGQEEEGKDKQEEDAAAATASPGSPRFPP